MVLTDEHVRSGGREQGPRPVPRVALSARRRRLPLAAMALLFAAGSALASAVLYLNAGDRRPVLAVATPVSAGQAIKPEDVVVVRVSVDPQLAPVPAGELSAVVGQPAATDLAPGTLLTQAQLGAGSPLQPGQAMVGLALQPGEMPNSRLHSGERVRVVQTLPPAEPGGGAEGGLGRVLAAGRVAGVEPLADASGTVVVSLVLAEQAAPAVAGVAAADRVSLVLVPTP